MANLPEQLQKKGIDPDQPSTDLCVQESLKEVISLTPIHTLLGCSTDVFQLLGDTNYDFLYQSLLLYAQQTAGELHNESPNSEIYHFHITCNSCLRPIEEPTLEVGYQFPDKSQNLKNWKPENVEWMKKVELLTIPEGQWDLLGLGEQSREVGCWDCKVVNVEHCTLLLTEDFTKVTVI